MTRDTIDILMRVKRSRRTIAEPAVEPQVAPPAEITHHQKVGEQIARLEQRHRELVEETAHELATLKQQLAEDNDVTERVNEAKQPLLSEIATLRSNVSRIEQEKQVLSTELQRLHEEYQNHYHQLHGALGSLKHVVQNQAQAFDQQVRLFSLDTEQAIEELLSSIQKPTEALPVVEPSQPLPVVTDDNLEALLAEFSAPTTATAVAQPATAQTVKEPRVKKERRPRSFAGLRRFTVRAVALALVVAVGWNGLKFIQKKNMAAEAGQVAGVSTTSPRANSDATGSDPFNDHPESRALVSFDQTAWEPYADPDLGITMRWPKNASFLLKTPGSTNIWLVRFDSYMMRANIDATTNTLEQWWQANSSFYSSDGTPTKGTFKNRPAWIVPTTGKVPGTTYIVQNSKGILQIWVESSDAAGSQDDQKRLAKLVDSLTISN